MRGDKQMQEITIYNKNGELLTELAQWDKNVPIQICEKDIDGAYNVHFINCNSKEAMVVKSTYKDGTLYAVVPNDILTEPHSITGYVWTGNDTKEDEEHKSTYCFRIVVRKRPKPANYVYSDQKEYITFENVLEEAMGYAEEAESSKTDAGNYAVLAESYARGGTNKRDGEAEDNAKYYCEQTKNITWEALSSEANAEHSANFANQQAELAAVHAAVTVKKAGEAKDSAAEAESWTHGNTNTRENETTDNAKYYCDQSQNNSSISKEYLTKVEQAGADAVNAIQDALDIDAPRFQVDLSTGCLLYEGGRFMFNVNNAGHLEWGLAL